MLESASSLNSGFKAERDINFYYLYDVEGNAEEPEEGAPFAISTASVEVDEMGGLCTLDESEYCFSAEQCSELAGKLAWLIQGAVDRLGDQVKGLDSVDLALCRRIYEANQTRGKSEDCSALYIYDYDTSRYAFGAVGGFRHVNSDALYGVTTSICDELCMLLLGIEDRVFRLGVTDTAWLMEQLFIGGRILAGSADVDAGSDQD